MRAQFRFGIDLGGTKTEIIALEGSDERLRRRLPTPQGDYPACLQAIAQLVRQAEHELGGSGTVGIGIPGTRSPDHGRIKNANSVCLIGQDLQGDLEQLLQRPIRLANDADCFALSEASDGSGAGADSVFGVILGTGVGGRRRDPWPPARGAERDCRRMGAQRFTLAQFGRWPDQTLLLRPG